MVRVCVEFRSDRGRLESMGAEIGFLRFEEEIAAAFGM